MRPRHLAPALAAGLLAAGLLQACGAGPAEAGRLRIAFLSPVERAADQESLDHLRQALARFGHDLNRLEIDHQRIPTDKVAQDATVAGLLRAPVRPYAVVLATTMNIAQAAKAAATRVPIVFDGAADPIRFCLVQTMTRPGGNATGYTSALPAEPKMLEALADAFPQVRHAIVLMDRREPDAIDCPGGGVPGGTAPDPAHCPPGAVDAQDERSTLVPTEALKRVARRRDIGLSFLHLCSARDFGLIGQQVRARPGAAIVVPLHYLFYAEAKALTQAVADLRVPAIYPRRFFLDLGGAVALSPIRKTGADRPAFQIVARVLRGHDPARIPVELPLGFELAIDIGAAQRSGLRPSVLALRRAQEIRP